MMSKQTKRNLLPALLAFGTMIGSAQAQAPQHGISSGYIATTYTAEVMPGQMENFKQLATKVIAAAAQEPGTLMYEWSLRQDKKTFDVVELYRDSEAIVAHINHILPEFGEALGQVQKTVSFTVYGTPNEAAKKALAALNPTYETSIGGFTR